MCDRNVHRWHYKCYKGYCLFAVNTNTKHVVKSAGKTAGLLVLIHVKESEYLAVNSVGAGARVHLGNRGQYTSMLEKGTRLAAGSAVSMAVSRTIVSWVGYTWYSLLSI